MLTNLLSIENTDVDVFSVLGREYARLDHENPHGEFHSVQRMKSFFKRSIYRM